MRNTLAIPPGVALVQFVEALEVVHGLRAGWKRAAATATQSGTCDSERAVMDAMRGRGFVELDVCEGD